ncbi:hypothetical protein C2G38_2239553 [Gigaspora rosea]|uniref:Uncharacterized protein n=1 Tax=Gigaspora rosea TaxID=44941 RepID=A0A397W7X1_9GLOM|nr:hypothetical protein C2G38_2239553 [Gigaspora rosea]
MDNLDIEDECFDSLTEQREIKEEKVKIVMFVVYGSSDALVFGQNPLHYFTLLKEFKEQRINSEDELPNNWFEPSEPQKMISIDRM